MQKQIMRRFFDADNGAGTGEGGQPAAAPTAGEQKPAVATDFTPEQQNKINELINKAFAKGAAKAAKEHEDEKLSEAEKLAKERTELQAERAKLLAKNLLAKEGFFVEGDDNTNEVLASVFSDTDADVAKNKTAAVKKLIEAKVNAEVDKRLKSSAPTPPKGQSAANLDTDSLSDAEYFARRKQEKSTKN